MKPETMTPEEQEEYEERAAILEFEGRMERSAAEKLAMQLTIAKRQKRARIDPDAI